MEVSIIVPIYKVEKYLTECINSIINQTFKNIQIILVDDGSPDGCGKICDEFAALDPRILVIHQVNGGLSDARNTGLKAAMGKYVYFVDSDDYLELDAVSNLFEVAEKNGLDILMFNAISFEDNSNVAITEELENKYISKSTYPDRCSGPELFIKLVDNRDYRSPVQYLFLNRAFLQVNDLIFHRGILHEDEEFTFLALLYANRVMHLTQVLYHHRFRNDSIMGVKFSKANTDSMFEVLTTIIQNYGFFLDEASTSEAYVKGIGRLAKCFMDFRDCSDSKNSRGTEHQFRIIKRYFSDNQYFNHSEIKDYFFEYRKKHSTYNRLKRFVFSHGWTKKTYFFIKRIIMR